MCSAQAENRLELSDSLLLGHYCWGLHPGAPTPSQCASISPCEPQFKRAQSALKVCMGSGCACPDWVDGRDLLQRRSVTLTSAYYPDRLVPTLAGCALQSPRYGLLYCHFLEGRKEGRQEERKKGRKNDLRVQKFSYLLQPLLIPLSARASCFTQHTCDSNPCTLRSRVMTEESPLQWLFAPAYFDTVAMAIFSAQ